MAQQAVLDFTEAPLSAAADALRGNVAKLAERDRDFAQSLLDAHKGGKCSMKQAHWLRILAKRATTREAPPPASIGGLADIVALLDKAGEKLKSPKLLIKADRVGQVRIYRMGVNSRHHGSLGITSAGAFGDRTWYGRIDRDGTFQPSPRIEAETVAAVGAALTAMAADPESAARRFGRETGACCFCAIELTDPRSVTVGYGPICADKWGLPWGTIAKAEAAPAF